MAAPVRSVAVVGRDIAAVLIALGVHRALASVGVAVRLVELPSALGPGQAVSALPSLGNLHALLGLREEVLATRCGRVPVMAQQFTGWSATPFLHGYDVARPAINDVDFVQFWSLARRSGMRVPLDEFSLAAAAAKQGRVSGGGDAPAPGYHLDASAYAALLREGCAAAGVTIDTTSSVQIEREGERIAAIQLADGQRIEADFFVDASGAERVLVGDAPFESWAQWFPADRAFTAIAAPIDPPPAFARIAAAPDGWVGMFPLQRHIALAGHFAASGAGDEADAHRMLDAAGIAGVQALTVRPFACGALRRSWIGNCVAVGEAAVALEELDAVELQVLQIALSTLVAWWPVDRDTMPEAVEYDRAIAGHVGNIRDFQLAHYVLSDRPEEMWRTARAAPPPERLAARLALFGARGILPPYDDETFSAQSWAAVLAGHGVVPAESDPAVDRTPPDEQIGKVQRLLQLIAEQVRAMPDMAAHLAARKAAR
ncbi:tryptophan 7-halogenase [Sphingomonas sp. LT1P40]|uniref:tryptophan 7-halogenase n=1 Tax=Alteristakelama amylovorans TaxID=3096166 RepID=UPI002FC83C84